MKLQFVSFLLLLPSSSSFQPSSTRTSLPALFSSTAVKDAPVETASFDDLVKSTFPGAISNDDLQESVASILEGKGFTPDNTLLATSLCCDELARRLEDVFVDVYGKNFNLGGLAGFPFAGNTGFGAMAAHIPDDGFSLIVYGPHVGIAQDGTVGKVEREGIALQDTCCGSAVAASNYLKSITEGGFPVTTDMRKFTDFQQGAVQKMILPYGQRLSDADNRMFELPYALYEIQDLLLQTIVESGISGTKQGVALLGGVQINTGPDSPDYFHPLRFEYMNSKGEVMEEMLNRLVSTAATASGDDKRQFLEDPVVLVNGRDDDDGEGAPSPAFFAAPKKSMSKREKKQQANQEAAKLVAEEDAKAKSEYDRLEEAFMGASLSPAPMVTEKNQEPDMTPEQAAEIVAKEEAKEQAKIDAEVRAKAEAEEQAKADAEAKAKAEEVAAAQLAEEQKAAKEAAAVEDENESKTTEVVVGGVFPQSGSSYVQSGSWWENPRGGIGQGSTYRISDDWMSDNSPRQEPGSSWFDRTR